MRITAALDWSWGQTTLSMSVPSTVGTKKGPETPSLFNHKVANNNSLIVQTFLNHEVPRTPKITVLPVYDQNQQLSQLTVQWMQQVAVKLTYFNSNSSIIFVFQIQSERCSFDHLLSYTVVLEDSTRERVDQRMILSKNCSDNLCSISFPFSSPDQSYYVSVDVTGAFGSTSTSISN